MHSLMTMNLRAYTIWAVYTCMLCTHGMIIFKYLCILLSTYSILPYWLIVCSYILYMTFKCVWTFIVYGCMLYYIWCLYHHISLLNIQDHCDIYILSYLVLLQPQCLSHGVPSMCLLAMVADLCSSLVSFAL